jgi:plastocyanin
MKRFTFSMWQLFVALALLCAAPVAFADDDGKMSVTVAFGAGLNTAQPGNAANHRILPGTIKVKRGGVVNFVVGGFHQIVVYQPGTRAEDIVVPAAGPFINDATHPILYTGLAPVGAAPAGFSNAQNRVESVSFAERGTYLVICNVRGHFLDGMYAVVKVDD